MIEHTTETGTGGQLKVVDKTDDPDLMMAEAWIYYPNVLDVPQLPWTYSVDGVMDSWKSFNFSGGAAWQLLGGVHVGNAETFTLHLGDTGTTELNGPTDLAVNLFGHVPEGGVEDALVRVRHDGSWKKAIPYVNVDGSWKQAIPYVRTPEGWKPTT